MSPRPKVGLFIYAKDLARVSKFYEQILGMQRRHQTNQIVVLEALQMHLIVHAMPPHIADTITIMSPPEKREDTALKFFFPVSSIASARDAARALGGEVFEENWEGRDFTVCNAMDPEGNIFQVREY
jgi:predicted enzyme related to lactoylglutathione lyase